MARVGSRKPAGKTGKKAAKKATKKAGKKGAAKAVRRPAKKAAPKRAPAKARKAAPRKAPARKAVKKTVKAGRKTAGAKKAAAKAARPPARKAAPAKAAPPKAVPPKAARRAAARPVPAPAPPSPAAPAPIEPAPAPPGAAAPTKKPGRPPGPAGAPLGRPPKAGGPPAKKGGKRGRPKKRGSLIDLLQRRPRERLRPRAKGRRKAEDLDRPVAPRPPAPRDTMSLDQIRADVLQRYLRGETPPCPVGCGGMAQVVRVSTAESGAGEVWLECLSCAQRARFEVPAPSAAERQKVLDTLEAGNEPLCPRHERGVPLRRRGRDLVCPECGILIQGREG